MFDANQSDDFQLLFAIMYVIYNHKFGSQVSAYMYSLVSGYPMTCSADFYLSKLPLYCSLRDFSKI